MRGEVVAGEGIHAKFKPEKAPLRDLSGVLTWHKLPLHSSPIKLATIYYVGDCVG